MEQAIYIGNADVPSTRRRWHIHPRPGWRSHRNPRQVWQDRPRTGLNIGGRLGAAVQRVNPLRIMSSSAQDQRRAGFVTRRPHSGNAARRPTGPRDAVNHFGADAHYANDPRLPPTFARAEHYSDSDEYVNVPGTNYPSGRLYDSRRSSLDSFAGAPGQPGSFSVRGTANAPGSSRSSPRTRLSQSNLHGAGRPNHY